MTRWTMVADLRRCIGCQTCTAACKHANATPPGVQWRRVIDMEVGEYPDVQRAFVPVGCQHCDEPPCMEVCPTTATGTRADRSKSARNRRSRYATRQPRTRAPPAARGARRVNVGRVGADALK